MELFTRHFPFQQALDGWTLGGMTQFSNKVGWTEAGDCRANQESLLFKDLLAKAHPSFSLDFQGSGCSNPATLSCLCRAG